MAAMASPAAKVPDADINSFLSNRNRFAQAIAQHASKGFTLVEILVVIVIMAVVISVNVLSVSSN